MEQKDLWHSEMILKEKTEERFLMPETG